MTEFEPCPFCKSKRIEPHPYLHEKSYCTGCEAVAWTSDWVNRPKSEAEELLEWLCKSLRPIILLRLWDTGEWVAEVLPDECFYGTTPLDALKAAREAMKDE